MESIALARLASVVVSVYAYYPVPVVVYHILAGKAYWLPGL